VLLLLPLLIPDAKLTPGDRFEVTAQDVCVAGYAKKVRAVPAWLKKEVLWRLVNSPPAATVYFLTYTIARIGE
jgi:hypothetical protein